MCSVVASSANVCTVPIAVTLCCWLASCLVRFFGLIYLALSPFVTMPFGKLRATVLSVPVGAV